LITQPPAGPVTNPGGTAPNPGGAGAIPGGSGPFPGGGACRQVGENCGLDMNQCCSGLACDIFHGFKCIPPATTQCGHKGDICGIGQSQCCQFEYLYCDLFGTGRCQRRADAPPESPAPPVNPVPPVGQPPVKQPPNGGLPISPPILLPPVRVPPNQPVAPPPPGIGGGGTFDPRIQYCPDGKTRCPTARMADGRQNCALCSSSAGGRPPGQPPQPVQSGPSAPPAASNPPKILCYIDLPSGLPTTVRSIGQATPSKDPYFIVYPGTDILMTCTQQAVSGLSTTNACEYLGPKIAGDGKTSLLRRYVCEATRRKQFCDGKFAGAVVQTPGDVQALEPALQPFSYGLCVPDVTEMPRFLQSDDPQVLGESDGVFHTFSCQPHQNEGDACLYADDSSNPYPYLAYKPTQRTLKKGKCKIYAPGKCSGSNPGISMPVWLYPTCRSERGLLGKPAAPWAGTDLGQWTGKVEIGTRALHGRFWYFHPGMIPGPVKLCTPP
jgi:hypothetical protein